MVYFFVQCSLCFEEIFLEIFFFISKRGKFVDVNRRIVYYLIGIGGGYEGFVFFCSIMNMLCIIKIVYYQYVEIVFDVFEFEVENDMK